MQRVTQLSIKAIMLICLAFTFHSSTAQVLVYREIFSFDTTQASNLQRALDEGWEGTRNGDNPGEGQLTIANGAPTDPLVQAPVNSDPVFGIPGYAFWGPDGVSGVAIYSNEFGNLGYSSDNLLELRWRNRNNNSGPGNPTNNDWRGLVYVNGIWYASQTTVNVTNTAANTFEEEVLDLSNTLWTAMTLDQPTDIGPRFPMVPNFQPLPSGPIEKVGIFTNFFFGRIRISSFEVYGSEPFLAIPTLGEWGLILLALGMTIFSVLAIKNSFVLQKKNS